MANVFARNTIDNKHGPITGFSIKIFRLSNIDWCRVWRKAEPHDSCRVRRDCPEPDPGKIGIKIPTTPPTVRDRDEKTTVPLDPTRDPLSNDIWTNQIGAGHLGVFPRNNIHLKRWNQVLTPLSYKFVEIWKSYQSEL